MSARPRSALIVARLFAVYALLCGGSYFFGAAIVRPLTPIFKMELEALRPEYAVDRIVVERDAVELTVSGTHRHRPGFRARTATSFGFTYPILILSLLGAWPFATTRRRLAALGVAAIALVLVGLIDLPVSVLLSVAEVAHKKEPFLSFFFYNGGRQFLALLIFALAVALSPGGLVRSRSP